MFNPLYDPLLNDNFQNQNVDRAFISDEGNYFYKSPNYGVEDFFGKESQDFYYSPLEDKITAFVTNEDQLKINRTAKIEGKNNSLEFNEFNDIKELLETNNKCNFSRIIQKLIKDEKIEQGENNFKLLKKKRKRRNHNNENVIENKENTKTYRQGRKKKDDLTKRNHNKLSPDNIVKKIKSKLFDQLILFFNQFLDSYLNLDREKKEPIKDLDYKKYIDPMKKEQDLKILGMTLKEFYSLDISPKYANFSYDHNKKSIEALEEKNDKIIQFVLNLKVGEWISLFTLKKNVEDFGLSDINAHLIEKSMPKLIRLFEEIIEKEKDDQYLSNFIFYLFNYESWFLIKRGRK